MDTCPSCGKPLAETPWKIGESLQYAIKRSVKEACCQFQRARQMAIGEVVLESAYNNA